MLQKLRSHPSRLALGVAVLILAVTLGQALILFARNANAVLGFPYPLEYAEGPVLDQVLRLAQGEPIYRTTLDSPPYTITNDPPLYLLLQAPLARLFGPAFWYGRALSLVSLFVAALCLGLTLYTLNGDRLAALIGGLLLFTIPTILKWSVLDRADATAFALSWVGLFLIVRWPERILSILGAGVFFSAAAFTQQTYWFVAPAAALAWLVQTRRLRRAAELLAASALLGAAAFLGLNVATQGGFFFNLFTASTAPWFYQDIFGLLIGFFIHGFLFVLIALFYFIFERLDQPTSSWPFVFPYFLCALIISLWVGKPLSSDRCLFELAAACCLASGAALAWIRNQWVKAIFLLLLVFQINGLVSWSQAEILPAIEDKITSKQEINQLADLIRKTDGPLLVDEYNGLLPLMGRRLDYQPIEYVALTYNRVASRATLAADLSSHRIKLLLIYFPRDVYVTLSRYPPDVYSIITVNYANSDSLANTLIFRPK